MMTVENNDENDNTEKRPSRLARWKSRIRKHSLPVLVALTFALRTPGEASAAPIPEKQMYSLRPGVTEDVAEELAEGTEVNELGDVKGDSLGSALQEQEQETTSDKKKLFPQKKNQRQTLDYGVDDMDEEEEDYEPDEETFGGTGHGLDLGSAASAKAGATPVPTTSTFAGVQPREDNNFLYFKAFMGVTFPVVSVIVGRGVIQEYRNQQILKKAIDIMDAQKAEYFNVTATNSTDLDIEDELKDMKKNETDAGDDEDEDEDDDEDAPPTPKKRPKRGGPSGSGGGTDGGDVGGGRPSDEDLERLNQMFKKS